MINPDTRYTREFTVSSYDVDAGGKISLQAMCRYLQEMATRHAIEMKLGFNDMLKENRAWVLAQMLVKMDRYPGFTESFTITTWSNGPDGRFALRDFEIRDAAKNFIGGASSTWFVIDIAEKNICRLDEYFPGYEYKNISFSLGRKPERVRFRGRVSSEEELVVKYSELDINGHMNNVRYIDHIIDMLPDELKMNSCLTEIEMSFLKESKSGQRLKVGYAEGPGEKEFLHYINNVSEDKAAFTARTCWR